VTGAVVANSTAEVAVADDDNLSHTIPMGQLKSVNYDDSPPGLSQRLPNHRPSLHHRATADPGHIPQARVNGYYAQEPLHPPQSYNSHA
jgi:hypothetical protein